MATEKEEDLKRYEDDSVVQETAWSRISEGRKVSQSTNLQRDVAFTLPEFDKPDIEEETISRPSYTVSKRSITLPEFDRRHIEKRASVRSPVDPVVYRTWSSDKLKAFTLPEFDKPDIEEEEETIPRPLYTVSKPSISFSAPDKEKRERIYRRTIPVGSPWSYCASQVSALDEEQHINIIKTASIPELAISSGEKNVRESDDDEWESDDPSEVEKRDKLKLGSKHTTKTRLKASNKQKGRMKRTGKNVRESDDDEWESDDPSEVEKRDKLKLGSKHTTKTRLKARNKQKGRMKRTGKYVRQSDDDKWESGDLSEVEKRDKLKLGSKHTTKTRLKVCDKQKGRMKRTDYFTPNALKGPLQDTKEDTTPVLVSTSKIIYNRRHQNIGKNVRESDDDEWESNDPSEVEKRDKLKLGSKHITKTRLKARNKQKGRMKRTGTRKMDVPALLEMLYLVYNELVSLCIDIASVYATTTPNNAKDPILLCLTTQNCHHIPPKFKGFSTTQKPFYPELTESESCLNETYKYDAKICKEIDETIAFHAESLMMKHKNLEAIKMGLVRSSKNNVIQEQPGIVLVCRYKSYIPIDESYFPSKLQHPSSKAFYHTDVKEGYFRLSSSLTRSPCEYNKELAMGCSIGPENDGISASLGPFVNIQETNELCFLTVRHLFQPLDVADEGLLGINVVQPAISDTQQKKRLCGTVKVAELSNNIDAALVEIRPDRVPNRGYFVGIKPGDLHDTGFAPSCFPSYDDGCVKDARHFLGQDYAHDRVIKFGKQTGLTKGAIQTRNMAVRLRDETGEIQYGSRMQSRLMIQQLQVDSFARKIFFEKGDSGSAVFSVDKSNKLFCIGMAIGVMSDKTCIVTPIQNILERLGQKLRQTLELKAFPSEKMEI